MGFLSNLISRETRRAVNQVVDRAVDEAVSKGLSHLGANTSNSGSNSSFNSGAQTRNSYSSPARQTTSRTMSPAQAEKFLRDNIQNVFARDWSTKGYELRTKVPASELNAPAGARAYSYGLYLNGTPKCMIMVLTDRNHYRRKDVVLAQQAARNAGVTYLNFFTHLPNREDYIAERLQKEIH